MGKRSFCITFCSLISLLLVGFVTFKKWGIAEGYTIRFDGKYAHGTFNDLKGEIMFDIQNPGQSKFDVTIDVASIDTGIELKNKHARSDKWFDAQQFTQIHFISSNISETGDGYVATGILELRGVKQEVQIPFTFNASEPAFRGSFKVNRGDFGIGKVNETESDSTKVEIFVPVLSQ